jgi:hypothetical protein
MEKVENMKQFNRNNSTHSYPCNYTEVIGQFDAPTPGNYEGKMRIAFYHEIA